MLAYRTLHSAVKEFETDRHRHIHLENNVLFLRRLWRTAPIEV
jgi:iron-sulfur cluster repair protein YtfE (RIC family)